MRGSKNSSGLSNEKKISIDFHSEGSLPLLISPALLRSRNLGQIDLARLIKLRGEWVIELAEVKSSGMGEASFLRGQKQRLLAGLNFLCGIFGKKGKLSVIVG